MAQKAKEAKTKGKTGPKPLPSDPREAFFQLASIRAGNVVRAIQTLGKMANSTCPSEDGEMRVPVDYDPEHVDEMEEVIMSELERAFKILRDRPPVAAQKVGFTFTR